MEEWTKEWTGRSTHTHIKQFAQLPQLLKGIYRIAIPFAIHKLYREGEAKAFRLGIRRERDAEIGLQIFIE